MGGRDGRGAASRVALPTTGVTYDDSLPALPHRGRTRGIRHGRIRRHARPGRGEPDERIARTARRGCIAMAAALAPITNRYDQAEVVSTIKQTVCKGATDAQLRMFLEVCRSTGLDPFLKEIYYVAEKGIIMAARDGYLRVANENPQFDGMETRVERDERQVPIKATCTVWRKEIGRA